MEGEHLTAQLFDRQTGQTVSALDARWNPEYGNRGELEARIGSIISHLDGALSQLAQMPVVHPHLPSSYGIIRSAFTVFYVPADYAPNERSWRLSDQSACV